MDLPVDISQIGLRGQSAIGLVAFVFIAWLFSERKLQFPLFSAIWTIGAQILIAGLLLYTPGARDALAFLNIAVEALQQATQAGTSFVFGHLGGGPAPFEVTDQGAMFNFAFGALPLVIFFSGLSALLWHIGILKIFIRGLAVLLTRIFNVGGAVALSAAANTFLGQTEAPLLIRAFLSKLSRSELFIVITGGFATVAGSVMVLYATLLEPQQPSVLGHIIVASLISVPAAILMAQVMIPAPKGEVPTASSAADDFKYASAMDAFMRGVTDGLGLYLNILASLIAFTAFAALVNIMLGGFPDVFGSPLTLERMLGWVFAPLMWLTGVPWAEAFSAGSLMGVKTAVNEIVAYVQLANLPEGTLSERSTLIVIYSLCGFANFASLGIVIGGLTALAPERRQDVISLAPKALVAGTLATLMTGAVIGLIWMG
ncbi:MAG: nucleoside:proton symporter [Hyphococcus sp.]|nr:MAG: nucleoside:proton symporter [Marinicaulis sp.]